MGRKKLSEYSPEVAAQMRADLSAKMRNAWTEKEKNGLGVRVNGALQEEVQQRISESVKKRWKDGAYNNRINGMLNTTGQNHHRWTWGKNDYAEILEQYIPKQCMICGEAEDKIDCHHIDERRSNYLLSNLMWVCVPCHLYIFHYEHGVKRKGLLKQPFVTISKKFKFEYSHILPWHPGKCSQLHGHSGKLKVTIRGRLDPNDVVQDFYDIGQIVKMSVVEKLDHRFLNDFLPNPTSEAMLFWMWHELELAGLKGLHKLEFKETDSSSSEIRKKDVLEAFGWDQDVISSAWQFIPKCY